MGDLKSVPQLWCHVVMEYSGAETLPFDLHHSPTTSISDPPCSVTRAMQWVCEHGSFQMHRCKQIPKTQNDFPLETMQYMSVFTLSHKTISLKQIAWGTR